MPMEFGHRSLGREGAKVPHTEGAIIRTSDHEVVDELVPRHDIDILAMTLVNGERCGVLAAHVPHAHRRVAPTAHHHIRLDRRPHNLLNSSRVARERLRIDDPAAALGGLPKVNLARVVARSELPRLDCREVDCVALLRMTAECEELCRRGRRRATWRVKVTERRGEVEDVRPACVRPRCADVLALRHQPKPIDGPVVRHRLRFDDRIVVLLIALVVALLILIMQCARKMRKLHAHELVLRCTLRLCACNHVSRHGILRALLSQAVAHKAERKAGELQVHSVKHVVCGAIIVERFIGRHRVACTPQLALNLCVHTIRTDQF
mmetsp:Transcript_501/g.1281  ORF Transcript_501/g.1281 Transcript_501/m.1281 type:complete len:321 (-) Transcript_501:55-1017(-)